MKIDTERQDDHQVKLTVAIEPGQLIRAKKQAARAISRRTKIPGFRPGKAPFQVVQRHVGEGVLLEEALELLIEDLYPEVINESGIDPYGPGTLEDFSTEDQPVFKFLVPLSPEVTLSDYQGLRLPYEPKEVTEDDILLVLKNIQENQAIIEPVDRKSAQGDIVYVKLIGRDENPKEGDDEILLPERSVNFLIHPEDQIEEEEWPFAGFSQQLIGLQTGEEKTITHTFPENHDSEHLNGKQVAFTITVEEVKSRSLPEINDELAISFGEFENLEELKADILQNLKDRAVAEYNEEFDDKILTDIVDGSTIKYPPQMLDLEIEALVAQLEDRLATQGLDLNTYLKTREMDREQLVEEFRTPAEERLQKGLVLSKISKQESIQIDADTVKQEADETIDNLRKLYPQREDLIDISTSAYGDLVTRITNEKVIEMTLERLRSIAQGELEAEETPETAEETADEPAHHLEGEPKLQPESKEPPGESKLIEDKEPDDSEGEDQKGTDND